MDAVERTAAQAGTTTDAPLAGNVTEESATARSGVSLWKRIVNVLIALLGAATAGATVITTWGPPKIAAMQAGAFTVALGAAYKHVRIWSSPGASTYRVNWGAAADNTMAQADEGMGSTYHFATGQTTVYLFGDGAVGSVCVEAWN
jgi:hypothetical protein